jgi:hypothetical protein
VRLVSTSLIEAGVDVDFAAVWRAMAGLDQIAQAAEKSWCRLDGHNQLPKVIHGVKFVDGIEAVRQNPQAAA